MGFDDIFKDVYWDNISRFAFENTNILENTWLSTLITKRWVWQTKAILVFLVLEEARGWVGESNFFKEVEI